MQITHFHYHHRNHHYEIIHTVRYYLHKSLIPLIVIILFLAKIASGDTLTIHHIAPESNKDLRNRYAIDMLRLALEHTQKKNEITKLVESGEHMQQGRALRCLLLKDGIDVVWSMTSIDRESMLLPIRIPLLKGLQGYRIFIIRKEDKNKFANIKNLTQLQNLVAGQGHDWPDTKILMANGLKVTGSPSYLGLFHMLQHKRFDYFPRGINEGSTEIEKLGNNQLILDENLLLHYKAPVYFFVHPDNVQLADRLEKGLRKAIRDGSFTALLLTHPVNKTGFENINLYKRTVIDLDNPYLPAETPLDDKSLWFMF